MTRLIFIYLIFFVSATSKEVEYVIAYYNEDINWVEPYAADTHIYVKGPATNPPFPVTEWTRLPNVGREGHTYLFHILSNYDQLADVTFFLQGCISDHLFGKTLETMLLEAINTGFSSLGIPLHPKCGIKFKGFIQFWKELFHKDIPTHLTFYTNGCFAVRKELIHKHPKEFYSKLFNYLNHSNNPIEGHYLERLWYYLYAPDLATDPNHPHAHN